MNGSEQTIVYTYLVKRKTARRLYWISGCLVVGLIVILIYNHKFLPFLASLGIVLISLLCYYISKAKNYYPLDNEKGKIQDIINQNCNEKIKDDIDCIKNIYSELSKKQDDWNTSLSKISMWAIAGVLIIRYTIYLVYTEQKSTIVTNNVDISTFISLISLTLLLLTSVSTPVIVLFKERIDIFPYERHPDNLLELICYNLAHHYLLVANYITIFLFLFSILSSISIFVESWIILP